MVIVLIIRSILINQVNQLKQSCSNDVKKYYNLLFYEDRIEMYTGEKMTRVYDYHMFSSVSKTANEYILFNKNTPVLIIQYEQLNSDEAKTLQNIISSKTSS
ncbi:MAG: YcxB family protein [Erysipelotrichaceae bacterium]|nr:YcxB family protein [Erysipelotrichaceae bacterium]